MNMNREAQQHVHVHHDQNQNQVQQDFHDRDGGESGSRTSTPSPTHAGSHHHQMDNDGDGRRRRSLGRTRTTRAHSTLSLLDSMERRTQRTYRYGIRLVCIGATLNWLGFAQGHGYVDPLRYLGVACVISGSFCVCMAMCRWLGKPVASRRISRLQTDDHGNGDVHVINLSVPSMYIPSTHNNNNDQVKPPDYDIVVCSSSGIEPPPYEEAIKLYPGSIPKSTTTTMPSASASSPVPPMTMPNTIPVPVRPVATIERERSPSNNNYFRRSTIPTSALYQATHRPIGRNLNEKVTTASANPTRREMPIVSSSSNSSLLRLANVNAGAGSMSAANNNSIPNYQSSPPPPPPPYRSTADFTCFDIPLTQPTTTANNNLSSHARRLSLESLRSHSKSTFIP